MWRSAVQLCLGLRKNGGLAQLARASALHAEGQRFESVILHQSRTYCEVVTSVVAIGAEFIVFFMV
mgnify:CR=1 FL=1